jgi:hypothetical protein
MLERFLTNLPLITAEDKLRREALMQAAKKSRLLHEIRSSRPSPIDHLLAQIGGELIIIGKKLQRRCCTMETFRTKIHPSRL